MNPFSSFSMCAFETNTSTLGDMKLGLKMSKEKALIAISDKVLGRRVIIWIRQAPGKDKVSGVLPNPIDQVRASCGEKQMRLHQIDTVITGW